MAVDPAVEPTCTSSGLTQGSHCSACGEVLVAQRVVPALGHSYVDGFCIRCDEIDPDLLETLLDVEVDGDRITVGEDWLDTPEF